MAELPIPGTTSPGKLVILYITRGTFHEVGSNLREDVDIGNVGLMADTAQAFADKLKDCSTTQVNFYAWKLVNPSGVTLYEDALDPPLTGVINPVDATRPSDSSSIAWTGKGQPDVGYRQGQTKITLFAGYWVETVWATPTALLLNFPGAGAMYDFLNNHDVIGADFFGSKGVWRNYINTQTNAHFQKKLGF